MPVCGPPGAPRERDGGGSAQLGPVSPEPGLWLVGDTMFPGQSTYAAAIGGARVAAAMRG